MAAVSAKKAGWELNVTYLPAHQTSMVLAVHIFVHVKRIILKGVIHGLGPVSVKLDGQEKPVHELVLFTSMGRSVLRVASVEMGHSVIQLMATAYVLQVTTGHCVMSIVQSSDMDKNVNSNAGVNMHTAALMSLGSVSASQDGKASSVLSPVHLELMEKTVPRVVIVSTMGLVIQWMENVLVVLVTMEINVKKPVNKVIMEWRV